MKKRVKIIRRLSTTESHEKKKKTKIRKQNKKKLQHKKMENTM